MLVPPPDMEGYLPGSLPPPCLALPAMTQFGEWLCLSLGVHYLPASMGIDVTPSTRCTCSFQCLLPHHIT